MDSYQALFDHISQYVVLSDEEKSILKDAFKLRHIKKRQMVVQPSFTASHRTYVVEGAFRAHVVCHQGDEHTILMAIDDWWITDTNSYFKQQPATMTVVAVENSNVLQIDYATEEKLKKEHHVFERYFRIINERSVAFLQRRIISNLTLSAEARYESFLSEYSAIAQRMPQFAQASYLGMTTEYLSRLRNSRVH